MKIFLRLKHWQLFILLVGIPLVLEFVMFGIMFSKMFSFIGTNQPPDPEFLGSAIPEMFSTISKVMVPLIILIGGIYFSWFYSLGTNLHRKLPVTEKMNVTLFKVFLFFPALYMIGCSIFMCYMFSNVFSTLQVGVDFPFPPFIILLIFPFHFFAMFCIFYCIYFIAKSLKAVELQRPVTVGDYIVEFILLWFNFVGVWFIQPRINKIFANDDGQNFFVDNQSSTPEIPKAKY